MDLQALRNLTIQAWMWFVAFMDFVLEEPDVPSLSPTRTPTMAPIPLATVTVAPNPKTKGAPGFSTTANPTPRLTSAPSIRPVLEDPTMTNQPVQPPSSTERPNIRTPAPVPKPAPKPTETHMSSPCFGKWSLEADEMLNVNEWICSPNGGFRLGLSSDNDFSIWNSTSKVWSGYSYTENGPTRVYMQGDGNVVVRDRGGHAVWASNTNVHNGARLVLDDAGLAEIVWQGRALWRSIGCGHRPDYDVRRREAGPANGVVDASTLTGKIVTGYQGWFNTYCTGEWVHWSDGGDRPDPQKYRFEMWPDQSEYDADELCDTGFKYADGSTARLFSSYNHKTVDRHVRWMSEYGIDGLMVQKFLGTNRCFRSTILQHARDAAEKYGRVFNVMYDISDTKEDTVYDNLKEDWKFLVDHLEITSSSSYLHHRSKPLLSIWGFGFSDRPGTPRAVLELLDWLQNNPVPRYRATVMGGVPVGWQDLSRSTTKKDPEWSTVYRTFDVISPWSVGRYSDNDTADEFRTNYIEPNLAECEALGIDYLPVVWPGFSWSYRNIKENTNRQFNEIPRNGGKFMWRQMYNAKDSGAGQMYVAMSTRARASLKSQRTNRAFPWIPTF